MKKLIFLFFAILLATTINGCAVRITPLDTENFQGTIYQSRQIAYSVVIDNQTITKATLIIDGDIRRSIPASIVTKYGMDCRGRFFIVKFPNGKSFNQKIFAGGDEMITITISQNRKGKKRVRFEKIKSSQCEQNWPRRRHRNDYRDDYRYRRW